MNQHLEPEVHHSKKLTNFPRDILNHLRRLLVSARSNSNYQIGAHEMRSCRNQRVGRVFRSTPQCFLHQFVASQDAHTAGRDQPFHWNPFINMGYSRPRLITTGPVRKHCRLLYRTVSWPFSCANLPAHLKVRTLESDLTTGVFNKSILYEGPKYIWIPRTKKRRFAHQGMRLFTEA